MYPNEEPPPVFDGQGLPEAFRAPLPPHADAGLEEGTWLVLGVGVVWQNGGNPREREIRERCAWSSIVSETKIVMETSHDWQGWQVSVRREVELINRSLISTTTVSQTSLREMPLRWFAHPFFPLMEDGSCCLPDFPFSVKDQGALGNSESAYYVGDDGYLMQKLDATWDRAGHFQNLDFEPGVEPTILQRHPKLGLMQCSCAFPTSFMPVWANSNTFSFEPYYERTVLPGQDVTWTIRYDF